ENETATPTRHVIGLVLAVLAIVVVVLIWNFGLHYLVGTIFEELRYVIFAVVGSAVVSIVLFLC
ncbi:hypothetical protein ACCS48_34545, partial [Rhizobium brockwellii]|uniref:hypothetical protein n=1 Tax=Rhizobium brockwellii TaxID=3019932 RepID=UPI003F9B354D